MRPNISFSCSQSFPGDEYRNHTSCISEAERYEKTIYRGARKLDESGTGHRQQQHQRSKKLTPQEAWNQTIEVAAETAPPSLKSYMDQLAMMENVPRKEKQFRNFTVNSLRLKGPGGEKIKGEIWALLSKVREEEKKKREAHESNIKQQKQPTPQKKDEEDSPNLSKEADSKAVSESEEELADLPSEKAVTKAMKKALKKSSNKQMKFKALRKQVHESLSLKADKSGEKKLKKLLKQCIDDNPKKIIMDGKIVKLIK